MSQIWIEKLRNAKRGPERNEILLRDLHELVKLGTFETTRATTVIGDIQEQMLELCELAFPR